MRTKKSAKGSKVNRTEEEPITTSTRRTRVAKTKTVTAAEENASKRTAMKSKKRALVNSKNIIVIGGARIKAGDKAIKRVSLHKRVGAHPARNELECDFCDFVATSEFHLKAHSESKHADNRMYFPCPHCSFLAGSNQRLCAHNKEFHQKGRYPCNKCDQFLNSPRDFLKHMLDNH